MNLADVAPRPELVWGVFTRVLGLSYFVAFAALSKQIVALAGTRGITPITPLLDRIRVDFPGPIRFFHFPTLLWFGSSDRTLRLLCWAGCAAAVGVILGGPASPMALAICWACYLSLDLAADFERPWDTLLLEAGLLALWLPPLQWLPDVSATTAPMAVIGWAVRWLFFRVMVGFGKQKFARSTLGDLDYLRGFFINQPMPTPLGYFAHRLPLSLLKLSIALTFVIELIVPFFVFLGPLPRMFAAVSTAGLMLVIQMVGSYSFFNVLVLGFCAALLDLHGSLGQMTAPWHASAKELLAQAFVLGLAIGGLLHLPFNHWCTRTFLFWPELRRLPAPLRAIVAFYRAIAPFHVVHAYGVFPPRSGPSLRMVPIIEGSRDGIVWEEYPYRFQPSKPTSAPRFCAPWHDWFEFTLPYEACGHNVSGLLSCISGTGNPYRYTRWSRFDCLLERLLEGSPEVTALFPNAPFSASHPPVAIRARVCLLSPTTSDERARTGAWWHRKFVATHSVTSQRRPAFWTHGLPTPELFHNDALLWKLRAPEIQVLLHHTRQQGPSAIVGTNDLTPRDLERYWHEFLPALGEPKLSRLEEVTSTLEQRFNPDEWWHLERIQGRLALVLFDKLATTIEKNGDASARLCSSFHCHLFVLSIMGQGRDVYERVWAEPLAALAWIAAFREEAGLFYLGIFRPETLRYHASKLHLITTTWGERLLTSPLRGVPDVYPHLLEYATTSLHVPVTEPTSK